MSALQLLRLESLRFLVYFCKNRKNAKALTSEGPTLWESLRMEALDEFFESRFARRENLNLTGFYVLWHSDE